MTKAILLVLLLVPTMVMAVSRGKKLIRSEKNLKVAATLTDEVVSLDPQKQPVGPHEADVDSDLDEAYSEIDIHGRILGTKVMPPHHEKDLIRRENKKLKVAASSDMVVSIDPKNKTILPREAELLIKANSKVSRSEVELSPLTPCSYSNANNDHSAGCSSPMHGNGPICNIIDGSSSNWANFGGSGFRTYRAAYPWWVVFDFGKNGIYNKAIRLYNFNMKPHVASESPKEFKMYAEHIYRGYVEQMSYTEDDEWSHEKSFSVPGMTTARRWMLVITRSHNLDAPTINYVKFHGLDIPVR